MIRGLENITDSYSLTRENCRFYSSPTGLLMAEIKELEFDGRVFLSLAFPFETRERYLCVMNEDKEELGMIDDVCIFDEETITLLKAELNRKYFAPKIQGITKFRENYGNTYWDCETDHGPVSFTVKDTHRSIIHVTEDRVFIVDCDGCRYEIESVKKMDHKSYTKIQLFL